MNHHSCPATLAALQEWFLQAATSAAAPELPPSVDLEDLVRPGPREAAGERLEIYRRSYFERLTECLADDYPAVRFTLGTEEFRRRCREYILAHPSRHTNLNRFGRRFSEFLRRRATDPATGPSMVGAPFASELAELEWTLVEALHSPTGNPEAEPGGPPGAHSTPEPLGALSDVPSDALPHLRFVPNPSARVLTFEYPVNAYLQAFFRGEVPEVPQPSATAVAVVRNEYKIWRIDLQAQQATVLDRLLAREPLAAALEGVDVEPGDIQRWFRSWTSAGMFSGVELP